MECLTNSGPGASGARPEKRKGLLCLPWIKASCVLSPSMKAQISFAQSNYSAVLLQCPYGYRRFPPGSFIFHPPFPRPKGPWEGRMKGSGALSPLRGSSKRNGVRLNSAPSRFDFWFWSPGESLLSPLPMAQRAVGRGDKGGWGHWPTPSYILKTNLDEAIVTAQKQKPGHSGRARVWGGRTRTSTLGSKGRCPAP